MINIKKVKSYIPDLDSLYDFDADNYLAIRKSKGDIKHGNFSGTGICLLNKSTAKVSGFNPNTDYVKFETALKNKVY